MQETRIETFLLIAETRNITDASAKLYLSQSTVSTRLKQLENYLGYNLFIRQKGLNKIELTKSGEAFLPLAKEYKNLTLAMKQGENISNKIHIKIAATNSIMQSILSRYLSNRADKFSKILYETRTRHSVEIFDDIYEDKIDIGISLKEFKYSGIKTIELVNIPFLIFKLADDKINSLDLSNYVYIPWGYEIDRFISSNFSNTDNFAMSTDSVLLGFLNLNKDRWLIAPESFLDLIPNNLNIKCFKYQNLPTYKIYLVYKISNYEKNEVLRKEVNDIIDFYKNNDFG